MKEMSKAEYNLFLTSGSDWNLCPMCIQTWPPDMGNYCPSCENELTTPPTLKRGE